jgi:hypothetical protein
MASNRRIHISHVRAENARMLERALDTLRRAVWIQKTTPWNGLPNVRKADRWLVYVGCPYNELLYEGEAITPSREADGVFQARFGRIRAFPNPRRLEELRAFGHEHGWPAWENIKADHWMAPEDLAPLFYEFVSTKPPSTRHAPGAGDAEYQMIDSTPHLREHALAIAGGKCQVCAQPGFPTGHEPPYDRYLEIHALDPPRNDLRTLIVVCPNCHQKYHHASGEVRASLPRENPF